MPRCWGDGARAPREGARERDGKKPQEAPRTGPARARGRYRHTAAARFWASFLLLYTRKGQMELGHCFRAREAQGLRAPPTVEPERGGTSSRRRDSGAFTCRLDAHPHAFSIFADKKLKRGEAPSHREAQGMGLGREGIGPGDGTGQGGNRTKWKWLVTLRRGLSAGGDRERLQGGRDAWAERGCSVWPGGIFLFSCKCF